MKDILIIGSLNMDMVIRTSHIPLSGETVTGHFCDDLPGGKGANQACAAGRLGSNAAMLGMVGRDKYGDILVDGLRAAGVDTSLVERCDQRTGQAIICVSDAGNNSIIVLPGANGALTAEHIAAHEKEIADSRYVMLQMEIPFEAVCKAAELAARHGCRVVLNPAPATGPLPQSLLKTVDYLTPNETELSLLTGLPVESVEQAAAAAKRLIGEGVRCVLATLGEKGALYVTAEEERLFAAFPVKPMDTTAAGDTFNAAFAVRLSEGATCAEAVSFANAAAGISVTRPGAQPSIPTREETERALREGVIK